MDGGDMLPSSGIQVKFARKVRWEALPAEEVSRHAANG